MKKKVLITCPPMLGQIHFFEKQFENIGWKVTAADVVQTLSEDELFEMVPLHDGWIIGDDPATKEVLIKGREGRLRAAVKWGIGVDNVDLIACEKLGIPISNTPGMFGQEVADLAMCYISGLARDAFFIDREIRAGGWPKPAGMSLCEKTIGVVGLGDIGRNIARRAEAHGLTILGWDPFAKNLPDYIQHVDSWPDRIEECDFLVFACALTEANRHMFNREVIDSLKKEICLVNVSRGPLVCEGALLDGLNRGIVRSAALDVFETEPLPVNSPLLEFPQCIFGSHNGSNTIEGVVRASYKAINILDEFLEGK